MMGDQRPARPTPPQNRPGLAASSAAASFGPQPAVCLWPARLWPARLGPALRPVDPKASWLMPRIVKTSEFPKYYAQFVDSIIISLMKRVCSGQPLTVQDMDMISKLTWSSDGVLVEPKARPSSLIAAAMSVGLALSAASSAWPVSTSGSAALSALRSPAFLLCSDSFSLPEGSPASDAAWLLLVSWLKCRPAQELESTSVRHPCI